MVTEQSRLTSKYQATIPEKIRTFMQLKAGDTVAFYVKDDQVMLRKASPVDYAFTKSLEGTLSEWDSENDEKAYSDL